MSNDGKFINFTGRPINVNDNEWFNLESSRRVKKVDGRDYLLWPRVTGTAEMIVQFINMNRISLSDINFNSDMKHLEVNIKKLIDKKVLHRPLVLSGKSIDDITDKDLASIKPFTFDYIGVDAKVTNIIDGDTFVCAFMIDIDMMSAPLIAKEKRSIVTVHNCAIMKTSSRKSKSYILLKLIIRLYGCDAADKDIPRKNAATAFVTDWLKLNSNKVNLQLMGYDNRHRTLAKVYSRNNNRLSLTDDLLNYRHPTLGIVAKPYHGGSKTQAWDGKKNT